MATVYIAEAPGLEESVADLKEALEWALNVTGWITDDDMKKILKLVEDINYAWAHS